MKTMAPDAPTSHTSARCKASTPGAAVTDCRELPAVAAYAMTYSRNSTQHWRQYFPSLPATNAKRLRKGALATKQSILSLRCEMDCFAEPVIGRAFARPVGSR